MIGIVEIKCPLRCRNATIRTNQDWMHLLPYLDEDNMLNPSSEYYHQIQGELSATNLPWCDLVIWCPSAILRQRIYPDEAWRARWLPELHFIYRTHLMRTEDQFTTNYQLVLKTGKTISLEKIISSNPALQRKFYSELMTAIVIHIGRWMTVECYPRGITVEYLSHFDEMKKKLCRECVIRYLIYSWNLDQSNPSITQHIQQLLQGDWKIEEYMWESAYGVLSSMNRYTTLTMPACFCRKI